MKPGAFALVVAAATVMAPTAPAHATFVPDVSMAGVALGTSDVDVLADLGRPTTTVVRQRPTGPVTKRYYAGPKVTFEFSSSNPTEIEVVTGIVTRRGIERTRGGTGVGTTERRLRATLRRVRCRNLISLRICSTPPRRKGARTGRNQTIFTISRTTRRITRISIERLS